MDWMNSYLKTLEKRLAEMKAQTYGYTSVESANYAMGQQAMLETIVEELRDLLST